MYLLLQLMVRTMKVKFMLLQLPVGMILVYEADFYVFLLQVRADCLDGLRKIPLW